MDLEPQPQLGFHATKIFFFFWLNKISLLRIKERVSKSGLFERGGETVHITAKRKADRECDLSESMGYLVRISTNPKKITEIETIN